MFNQLVIGQSQTTAGNSIVVLVSFLILMLLLKKFAWKPIMDIMEEREKTIARNIDKAEIARSEARRLAEEREREIEETRIESSAIIERARESARNAEKEMLETAKADIARMKKNAQTDIELERQQARAIIKTEVSELSIGIAEKMIGKELTKERQAELIDEFIERLADEYATK